MAGIDKTYADSYQEYKEFKDWADQQNVIFFDGYTINLGSRVYDWVEEDFDGRELPIMNTPTWMDIYLIQNCKSQFVLDRMKDVYSEEGYNKFKKVDLTSIPKDHKQNRKIRIKKTNRTKFPIHNKPYDTKYWWLQSKNHFWYNSKTKTWVSNEMFYPFDTNTAHVKSLKALVKHLRKQYLPKGVSFRLIGRYVGEEYLVTVH